MLRCGDLHNVTFDGATFAKGETKKASRATWAGKPVVALQPVSNTPNVQRRFAEIALYECGWLKQIWSDDHFAKLRVYVPHLYACCPHIMLVEGLLVRPRPEHLPWDYRLRLARQVATFGSRLRSLGLVSCDFKLDRMPWELEPSC